MMGRLARTGLRTGVAPFYYDQRIRQEGFDIEIMMQPAGINASEAYAGAVLPIAAVESAEQPL